MSESFQAAYDRLNAKLAAAQARIAELEAEADVRSGRWCEQNRAEGRGGCGMCGWCWQQERARADRADADADAAALRAALVDGEPTEHAAHRAWVERRRSALATDAGAALLERLRIAEENEAHLQGQIDEAEQLLEENEPAKEERGFIELVRLVLAERDALRTRAEKLEAAATRVLPFLPKLDGGPIRHSEHAQAAEALRAALATADAA